jgi:predicted amidophosphoribosyltransferase
VIEGGCVQCLARPAMPSGSAKASGRSPVCSSCSRNVVSGATFCGACGQPVHESTLRLLRAREMRARLDSVW